ncbi:2-phosphosulfolactate phosphatase [Rhodococcus sp. NM-2]|uniref:2-phosphosulfolactate phosphatase n=1 Tax=unclassified Rhodococcus (in: high G+C Gram-positive bacteria) TaxID=192944 RepID=UPI0024B74C19|nr:2-phosphosulfolactate phosphatase [Rhodococcus sp. IEGM 1307]MDI9977670.1 2-phosphosulfolactate phosphatase [Rhodococcus sp. IEGM 1307]
MNREHLQHDYGLRFDWGLPGAKAVGADADVAVVVDVLSFTTTLTVAVDAGIDVLPYRWNDDSSERYARDSDAVLAVGRSRAANGQISLSPNTIRRTAAPRRLVLPSPNGSTISFELGTGTGVCVGASLRNATAVADWIARHCTSTSVVSVIAAGEKWPGGELRPAIEDLWGAGAVLSALTAIGRGADASPEALAAMTAWRGVADTLPQSLAACASGRELRASGYPQDVVIAAEVDRSTAVPVLEDRVFRAAAQ